MKYIILLVLTLLPSIAVANVPENLVRDFSPVEGYVVEQLGNEFLVDLDASDGVRTGDILTLVVAGKELKHPVSGDTIGTLDATHKGFLRVSRLKKGYSFATLLPGGEEPQKGDAVKRYDQLPVLLRTAATVTEDRIKGLQEALPHLQWVASENADSETLITFDLDEGAIIVRMGAGLQDRVYPFSTEGVASYEDSGVLTAAVAVPPATDLAATTSAAAQAGKQGQVESAGIIRADDAGQENVWYGPHIDDAVLGLTTGDFDGDGRQEVAVASKESIIIARMEKRDYLVLSELEVGAGKIVFGIDAIDLDNDGLSEIYVSAFGNNQMASYQIGFTNGAYRVVRNDIPWNLRVVRVPGEGAVMLGQHLVLGNEIFWGETFQVVQEGQALGKGKAWKLPAKVSIYSLAPFKDAAGDTLFAYLTADDYLHVADDSGKVLWESPEYMGGSETRLELELPEKDEETSLFIRQRIAVNPQGEILVAENIGTRIMDRYRSFKESKLVAMSWNGLAANVSWTTITQNGYLADFTFADVDNDGVEELATAVKFARKGLLNWSDRSGLVVYELQ